MFAGIVAGLFGYIAMQVGYHLWVARTRRSPSLVAFVANVVLALVLSRMFAPILVVPSIIVAFSTLATRQSELIDRPWLLVTVAMSAFVLPLVLEMLGVLAPTWTVTGGALVIRGAATVLSGTRALVYLVTVHVMLILVSTMFAWRLARQRRDAQQRFEIQAWQLRQLLPSSDRRG